MRSRTLVLLLVLGGASGCQKSKSVFCGDLVCPEGKQCVEDRGICILPEQAEVCSGEERGARCEVPGVSNGICVDGICELSNCGDGNLTGVEVCDDGNNNNGDGCSGDCLSDETCGNGEVDSAVGEACDDGNNEDGDGCTSECAAAPCGNGRVDQGEACDDGNTIPGDGCNQWCTSDETCGNGVIDLASDPPESCDDGNTDPGDTCGSTCQIEICGNGIIDAGEDCDDENNAPGDGCGPSCLLEECGNGVLDQGEQCDDGDLQSHDGCNSACLLETLTWTRIEPGAWQRDSAGVAFDSKRGVVVLFGGDRSGAPLDGTWEFDGTNLVKASPVQRPAARSGHAMAYHRAIERTVVFGGLDVRGFYRWATWLWDGQMWQAKVPSPSPEPRSGAVMAYDETREELVLFGGSIDSDDRDDTWLFDGAVWREASSMMAPPPGDGGVIGYDPNTATVVLYKAGETWHWDGSEWSENSAAGPALDGAMGVEPWSGKLMIVGSDSVAHYESSAWNVTALTATSAGFGLAFDSASEVIWQLNDAGVSSLDATGYSPVLTADFPAGGSHLAFYHAGQREIYVEAHNAAAGAPYLYRFADDIWIPYAELPAAMEWFGFDGSGITVGNWSSIYHESTPGAWSVSTATPRPSPRSETAPQYDSERGVMVLYGGIATAMEDADQLWEYDGSSWSLFVPETRPPYRQRAGFCFETSRAQSLLFGGNVPGSGFVNDTWAWDGAVWNRLMPANKPSPRNYPHLAHNPDDGRTYLFGGRDSQERRDLWAFDGEDWLELSPQGEPDYNPTELGALIYDEKFSRFVLQSAAPAFSEDIWVLKFESTLSDEDCSNLSDDDNDGRTDCADPDCEGDPCDGGRSCREGACQ